MKKIALFAALCLFLMPMAGCSQSKDNLTLVKENMSEYGEVYFFSSNQNLPMSVVSGSREEPYAYDGKSMVKFDFALVVARLDGTDSEYLQVTIDGEPSQVLLEYNFRTGTHVADLQTKLSGDEEISVSYLGEQAEPLISVLPGFVHITEPAQPLVIGIGIQPVLVHFFNGRCDL